MGGGIAQTLAIEHPKRVRSLTSMMFTTGDMSVGQVHPTTMKAVFGGPPARTREEVVARAVRNVGIVGSPAFPTDPADVAERAGLAYDRRGGATRSRLDASHEHVEAEDPAHLRSA
jgi:hypothetical protein